VATTRATSPIIARKLGPSRPSMTAGILRADDPVHCPGSALPWALACGAVHDLAIVITSLSEGRWLRALLPTIAERRGEVDLDVVVADIESDDDTREVVAEFPFARAVPVVNRGFAHANNVALLTTDARYVLFLNPDTEVVDGTFEALLAAMDSRPEVGLAGVRQLTSDGDVYPTMRRFATPGRIFAEALWSERLAPSLGQRVLDLDHYERETSCDWTIGSFMLVRREALESSGYMDERYFFTGEEQDLCLRVRRAGWDIRHVPTMTIVHHVGKRGADPRFEAQTAFAELQYARKNFAPLRRRAYVAALALNYALRALPLRGGGGDVAARRAASRAALRVILGRDGAPFMEPPDTALPSGTLDRARGGTPT
jgi:N-acetylglucosaminyl-diphospho-decaprenol L-rhamnosyltransferase